MKLGKSVSNGFTFSIFSFINQGVSFLLLLILAKFILPDDYGQLSLYNTFVIFLGYIISLSTNGYESVSFFKKNIIEFKNDFTAIHIITIIVFVFLCILTLFFGKSLGLAISLSQRLIWIAVLYSFLNVFNSMVLSYYRVSEKLTMYGIISCGNAILNAALTVLFVVTLTQGWQGRIYAQSICGIAVAIIALLVYKRNKLLSLELQTSERYKNIIMWGLPLIPHMAAIWVRQGLDRYIINNFHTMVDVGLFSFALNLANIVIIVGSSFNNSFSVEQYKVLASELSGKDKISVLLSKTKKMALIFVVTTSLVVIICSIIVPLLLPRYSEALPYFWILSLYGLAQCLYFLVVNYLFYFKRNKEIMYTTFGTSLIHLALSLFLTRYSLLFTCGIYVIIQILIVYIIFIKSRNVINKELLKV